MFRTSFDDRPLGRAMVTAFAERVPEGAGPVADLGCGGGQVTAFLRGLGLPAVGLDLSPGMVAAARRAFPGLPFGIGSLTALPVAGGALAGAVAWYSLIHVLPAAVPDALGELRRALAPGAPLLLGFQVGDGVPPLHVAEVFGRRVGLDFHRMAPERVSAQLAGAGFEVRALLVAEPDEGEKVPQAHLLARRT
jgi:SAM-dependent methyltransferase